MIYGNNEGEKEKTGALSFLSANRKEELAPLPFFDMGVFRAENFPASGERDNQATEVIDLYRERMEVDFMAQFEKIAH